MHSAHWMLAILRYVGAWVATEPPVSVKQALNKTRFTIEKGMLAITQSSRIILRDNKITQVYL
jgi:hypothetical protein